MTERIYGGFWRRLIAYAIDKIVLYLILLFLVVIALLALELGGGLSVQRFIATGDLPLGIGLFLAYTTATFFIDMLYFIWFHGSVGQTPGKMLLGLRVIQASGEQMTFGAAFLRWVGTIVSSLFLNLGYLWIAIDGKKQGWHDKIAATLVIRTTCEPGPDSPSPSAPLPAAEHTAQSQADSAPPPADFPQSPAATELPTPPLPSSDTEAPRP